MSLNSDALRLFLGVVDAGSLSAAAEVLGHTASGSAAGCRGWKRTWASCC